MTLNFAVSLLYTWKYLQWYNMTWYTLKKVKIFSSSSPHEENLFSPCLIAGTLNNLDFAKVIYLV